MNEPLRFTFHQYGASHAHSRVHQDRFSSNRETLKPDQSTQAVTYRQLVQNGKRVAPSQIVRIYDPAKQPAPIDAAKISRDRGRERGASIRGRQLKANTRKTASTYAFAADLKHIANDKPVNG